MPAVIQVATIDNHEVVREGLEQYLAKSATDVQVAASTATVEDYLGLDTTADVVLLDLLLTDGDATHHIPTLVGTGTRVLVYTTEERPVPLRRAVEAGACGVLLKSDPLATVVDSVRRAAAGEFCCSGPLAHALLNDDAVVAGLSDRQVQVLRALDEGLDYRATARVLQISEGAVKTYLARIREKYASKGVVPRNTHHLTRLASDDGYLR